MEGFFIYICVVAKTRFYIGQIINGKKLICYTTNCARTEYYLTFEDKSRQIIYFKK